MTPAERKRNNFKSSFEFTKKIVVYDEKEKSPVDAYNQFSVNLQNEED